MSTKKKIKDNLEDEFVYLMDDSNMLTAEERRKLDEKYPNLQKEFDEEMRKMSKK